ncbi:MULTISPECIES: SDR family NAD(P)-dependent oxidoreductase [Pseudonocardia]|uniref:2-dehydro-3-deoxy-D-gluconate 5-dehydrogenase n=2 Tax=Pseudonocardia TaxID=1847 RepID=A0A1Y2N045_PSEAH|nr:MULTISPECIES: glucose 1-dehydrogenase [Pseudonocardia]OSY40815.1 2-dehydro-3-deoxy-D-gluconate 5-dehydrogenase [Pseudonocardia autotrophica]TDN71877.1 3-oxoacyl-[acyl-carrier protein] reductase/2-deoxy-D-gluconate 3-dehydrogenase [Pseudonocardia autotrophica]BBG02565.1 oxidoreductase [Pseudonocardia autotrophica]GEC24624.1 oxidoreductase [Pseudonocardia saturnea]
MADPRPSFDLSGRTVLITGGSGGLGSAIACGLAASGARVVVAGRDGDRLADVVARIRATGGEAVGVPVDITRHDERSTLVAAAVAEFGRLDVLINNAGATHRVPAVELTVEAYRRLHRINTEAALFLSQAAHPHLCATGAGSIINILSIGMWNGGPQSLLYRSSKAALHAITMVLAQEWAPDRIRVNAVAPGTVDAGMGAALEPQRLAAQIARTPLGRRGLAEEVVPAALYLAADASSYVTGTTLRVDGGAVSR